MLDQWQRLTLAVPCRGRSRAAHAADDVGRGLLGERDQQMLGSDPRVGRRPLSGRAHDLTGAVVGHRAVSHRFEVGEHDAAKTAGDSCRSEQCRRGAFVLRERDEQVQRSHHAGRLAELERRHDHRVGTGGVVVVEHVAFSRRTLDGRRSLQ